MKVSRVELYKADIPLKEPFRISLGEIDVAHNLLVKIDTDDRLSGFGEGSPFPFIVGETQGTDLAAASDLAGLLLGKDPLEIEDRCSELAAYLPHNPTVVSAFDMALYDLLGKAADLPLYSLLGGSKRSFFTDRTVGIDSPAKMVEDALAFRRRGFPAIKVKLGTSPVEDIARIAEIRKALGTGVPIRIDANQGWSFIEALEALRGMGDQGVQYCEQPVAAWDLESMHKLSARSRIPIMADESLFDDHDAARLIAMEACDYLNIKLAKSGGIRIALRINAVAEASGVRCMLGCMNETRLALTAAAHVVSARKNIHFADLDSADFLTIDPIVGGIEYGEDGRVVLPDEPGIGAGIEESFLSGLESFLIE